MAQLPLTVLLRSYIERLRSGSSLTGAEIATCLQQLTAHEVLLGGPYARHANAGHPDLETNQTVALFLDLLGVSLPALDAYLGRGKRTDSQAVLSKQRTVSESEARIRELMEHLLSVRLKDIGDELAGTVRALVSQTMERNSDGQMSCMPYYLREALRERGSIFSDTCIAELGLANTFFWTSFIAYDDFWDEDEAAMPAHLPAANFMARHYIHTIDSLLPGNGEWVSFFHSMLDRLDAANAWEVAQCRMKVGGERITIPDVLPSYQDFGIKFYPAAGQCIAPAGMLSTLGYGVHSTEVAALIEYFRHYLVAMQLNDDLHDWKEDLARGHISTAVAVLLLVWKREYPEHKVLDLVHDREELEELFWNGVVDPLCACVLERANKSRIALLSLGLPNPQPLMRFVDAVELSARGAQQMRKDATDLVDALAFAAGESV